MSKKKISERLRIVFQELYPDESLAQIARRVKVTPNTINNYLQHDRLPSTDFLLSIANSGADINWLLTGEGTPTTGTNQKRITRIEHALSFFSNENIMAEVDRRMILAVDNAQKVLNRIAKLDIKGVAKKIKTKPDGSNLTDEECQLVVMVHEAYWTYENVMWWYPDLDPAKHNNLDAFLSLYNEMINQNAFRQIEYYYTGSMIKARSTP